MKIKQCINCKKKLRGKQSLYCCLKCNYKINRIKIREYRNHWKKRNPEKIKEYRKHWKKRNPEYNNFWIQKRRIDHPEKYKTQKRKQRLNEMKEKEKYDARRFGYLQRESKCKSCGGNENLEFHHTNYILKEGFTLCLKCHRQLHNQIRCKAVKK